EQTADAVVLFEDGDFVAGARELLCRGESGRSAADDRYALAGFGFGGLGADETLVESAIDDGSLDLLDGDRRRVDAEHTAGFAGRGADSASELGEVVGGVKLADGLAPLVVVHEVVPIGNDVGERAAGVAERHAAIHAACGLGAERVLREELVDFEPV